MSADGETKSPRVTVLDPANCYPPTMGETVDTAFWQRMEQHLNDDLTLRIWSLFEHPLISEKIKLCPYHVQWERPLPTASGPNSREACSAADDRHAPFSFRVSSVVAASTRVGRIERR